MNILSGAGRVAMVGLVALGLCLGGVGSVSASGATSGLAISYDPATVLPITAGEANVVIDVAHAAPGSTPVVVGVDDKGNQFGSYTGPAADPTPGAAFCTVADAQGDATCYISVPKTAAMPVTFSVKDQVSITNQLPEVPFAAGLPLLLALALPARRWLRRRQGAAPV